MAAQWTKRTVKLTKQKNFRCSMAEDKAVQRAARDAGLTESQWLRLVVRAALGETKLLEQLTRASGSATTAKRTTKTRGREGG